MPKMELENKAGWMKVVAGKYGNYASPIPAYLEQFIYHIHLEPGKTFSLDTQEGLVYAAFLPEKSTAVINEISYEAGKFLLFETISGSIEVRNPSDKAIDLIVFGGAPYTEPFIAKGSFVMSTADEITMAYNDYFDGKYGTINYEQDINQTNITK